MGSPCARSWSDEWIATVNATESQLNHRICGARLPDGSPCTRQSNHSSGRCPLHGGFNLTGAPPGNRNHVIHGLYSRRLRTCNASCPHWQSCPCANHDTPDLPAGKAPTCPYQLTEYNTVLTDALAIVESQPHPSPMGIHVAHNVATLQVLISNAATQLVAASQVAEASQLAEACSSESPQSTPTLAERGLPGPNPNALNAYLRLSREFRASLKLLYGPGYHPLNRQKHSAAPPTPEGINRHLQRLQRDTAVDPDSLIDAQLEPQSAQTHARAYLQEAALVGGQSLDVDMCEAFDQAALIDEPFADSERDHILACYRPAKHSVSEELAKQILGNLHLPPIPSEDAKLICPHDPKDCKIRQEIAQTEREYLGLFRDGKLPPGTFPVNSPLRKIYEEHLYHPELDEVNIRMGWVPGKKKEATNAQPA